MYNPLLASTVPALPYMVRCYDSYFSEKTVPFFGGNSNELFDGVTPVIVDKPLQPMEPSSPKKGLLNFFLQL